MKVGKEKIDFFLKKKNAISPSGPAGHASSVYAVAACGAAAYIFSPPPEGRRFVQTPAHPPYSRSGSRRVGCGFHFPSRPAPTYSLSPPSKFQDDAPPPRRRRRPSGEGSPGAPPGLRHTGAHSRPRRPFAPPAADAAGHALLRLPRARRRRRLPRVPPLGVPPPRRGPGRVPQPRHPRCLRRRAGWVVRTPAAAVHAGECRALAGQGSVRLRFSTSRLFSPPCLSFFVPTCA